jgi:hypothetical protein
MLFVAETNFIALLLGLLIGLVTAYWVFRGRRGQSPATTEDIKRAQETPLS